MKIVVVTCEKCQKRRMLPRTLVGKNATCTCGHVFAVSGEPLSRVKDALWKTLSERVQDGEVTAAKELVHELRSLKPSETEKQELTEILSRCKETSLIKYERQSADSHVPQSVDQKSKFRGASAAALVIALFTGIYLVSNADSLQDDSPVPPKQPVADSPVPPKQPVADSPVPPKQPVADSPVPPKQLTFTDDDRKIVEAITQLRNLLQEMISNEVNAAEAATLIDTHVAQLDAFVRSSKEILLATAVLKIEAGLDSTAELRLIQRSQPRYWLARRVETVAQLVTKGSKFAFGTLIKYQRDVVDASKSASTPPEFIELARQLIWIWDSAERLATLSVRNKTSLRRLRDSEDAIAIMTRDDVQKEIAKAKNERVDFDVKNEQNKKEVRERAVRIITRDLLNIRLDTQAAFLHSGDSYEQAIEALKPLSANLGRAISNYDKIDSALSDAKSSRDRVDDENETAKDAADDSVERLETLLDGARREVYVARVQYNHKWDEIRGIIVGAAIIVNTARDKVKQISFRHKDIIGSNVKLLEELGVTQQAIGEMLRHLPAMPDREIKVTKGQQELEEAVRLAKELHIDTESVFESIVESLAISPL